jgi:uncharacterized surface protein with fasciclin (FAS1) repeats
VSVGALVQRPLTSIIALPSRHVAKVADLAGKKVGTAGIAYQRAELQTALQTAGVNPAKVREVNVGFNLIPAMLSGKVDATLGGFWNYEGVQLQLQHRHPVVIPVDRAGVPAYNELVLVVREQDARRRGQDLRVFLHALTSGQQLTVFAPTDAAFLASPFGPLTAGNICTVPQGVLTDILLYHVETGRHFSNSVLPKKAGQAKTIDTLLGQSFKVGATGAIWTTSRLTTPRIVAANIAATNGVIHVVDEVLVPSL